MNVMTNNVLLKRLIAFFFALACFFPAPVVLALKDCGTHEIVSCEEHEGEHFVARHAKSSDSAIAVSAPISASGAEEHDSTHQIDKRASQLLATTISEVSTSLEDFAPSVAQVFPLYFEACPASRTLRPHAPPGPKYSFLSFLPSVRLQI